MKLTEAWSKREDWNSDYSIPSYDREAVKRITREAPVWLHFGAGNIFRAFLARKMDLLLEHGLCDKGIIVCEDFDKELIREAYEPYDCLSLLVTLKADGEVEKKVIGSVTNAVTELEEMKSLFGLPSLQLVSFTITEKGYSGSLMQKITELLLERYLHNAAPIALVSMDNCAHNGELLANAVRKQAKLLVDENKADQGFIQYLEDESRVSFPWTMIDKITPRPDPSIQKILEQEGFLDTRLIITEKGTYTAPFVNAEEAEYLVIEDKFPNGRPQLEAAGVLFADRATVDRTEKMKVGTCLNPLHTALAVFGCLLGYETIHEEMKDSCLVNMVWKLGYQEGLPVVIDPGIIRPEQFLKEVLTKRLPNVYMPDSPWRIATDTSQKLPIRFGQTLKAYLAQPELSITELTMIPLVFAGWLRYLIGVDDLGRSFEPSNDPRLDEIRGHLQGIELGSSFTELTKMDDILKDQSIFGVDLLACGLAAKVRGMLAEMLIEPGAVRKTLLRYCTASPDQQENRSVNFYQKEVQTE